MEHFKGREEDGLTTPMSGATGPSQALSCHLVVNIPSRSAAAGPDGGSMGRQPSAFLAGAL